MERQYSVQFFQLFIENLQKICMETLQYSQFVEVSGYVSVEIDNMKKERYVLSELLQQSGNVVSESFCTKSARTLQHRIPVRKSGNGEKPAIAGMSSPRTHRCPPKRSFTDQQLSVQSRSSFLESSPQHSVYRNSDDFGNVKRSKTESGINDDFSQFSVPEMSPLPTMNMNKKKNDLSCEVIKMRNLSKTQQNSRSPVWKSQQSESVIPVQLFKHKEAPCGFQETTSRDEDSRNSSSVTDEVIDLDDFEDDLDLDKTDSEEAGQSFDIDTQQKKSQLRPGTQIMVKNSVNQFKRFIMDKHQQDIDLLSCPPDRLNELLLEYFMEAKKLDGGKLRARSLKCVQERLILYLKEGDYPYSIIKDQEFTSSREYLKKRLIDEGRVPSHIYSPVDDNDIEMLFQAGQLGAHSVESLTNTMWLMNTKYFNIKGPAYHLDLKWGDIILRTDEQGEEFLERPLPGSYSLKVFASPENPARCWVHCYKMFRSLRPKVSLDESYAFYLKYPKGSGQESLYLPEPMVYYQLSTLWRKMLTCSGIPANKKIM